MKNSQKSRVSLFFFFFFFYNAGLTKFLAGVLARQLRKKNSIGTIRRAILIAFIRVHDGSRERQVNAITTIMVRNTVV